MSTALSMTTVTSTPSTGVRSTFSLIELFTISNRPYAISWADCSNVVYGLLMLLGVACM